MMAVLGVFYLSVVYLTTGALSSREAFISTKIEPGATRTVSMIQFVVIGYLP